MDRTEKIIDQYKEFGSFAEVARRNGVSRQRIAQIVAKYEKKNRVKIVPGADERLAEKVLKAYEEHGSYRAAALAVGIAEKTAGNIIKQRLEPDELRPSQGGKALRYPVTVSAQLWEDQWAFLADDLDQNKQAYVRDALDDLLADPDAKTIIERDMVHPKSVLPEGRELRDGPWPLRVTEEQARALDALSDELGKGTTAAAIRAAIDYRRESDAAVERGA